MYVYNSSIHGDNPTYMHAAIVPKAKKVVYSTCSIHPQENEHVVTTILSSTSDFVLGPRSEAIPTWKRRGLVEECNGDQGKPGVQYLVL